MYFAWVNKKRRFYVPNLVLSRHITLAKPVNSNIQFLHIQNWFNINDISQGQYKTKTKSKKHFATIKFLVNIGHCY